MLWNKESNKFILKTSLRLSGRLTLTLLISNFYPPFVYAKTELLRTIKMLCFWLFMQEKIIWKISSSSNKIMENIRLDLKYQKNKILVWELFLNFILNVICLKTTVFLMLRRDIGIILCSIWTCLQMYVLIETAPHWSTLKKTYL